MFYIIKDKKTKCMSSNKVALERILEQNEKVLELDLGGVPTDLVTVEENGTFTIPVIEYIPTKEQKINAIKSEYEQRFKKLEEVQQRLLLMGKSTTAISTQYITLNSEMVARIKEVQ